MAVSSNLKLFRFERYFVIAKGTDSSLRFRRKAKVYHVGIHPSARDVDFVKGLKRSGADVVSVETYTHAEEIVSRTELM